MRLIDADAMIAQYKGDVLTAQVDYAEGVRDVIEDIKNAPSIDIEPKCGEWINTAEPYMSDNIVCSVCGYDSICEYNFCPNCGARMKGATDGNK